MRCGVLLPTLDPRPDGRPPRIAQAARHAEQLGFDGLWAGDHLAGAVRQSGAAEREDRLAPGLDASVCLSVAAAVTERIALGFSAMALGLRPPAWSAKQLTTIDALSGSRQRLRLGVGVGDDCLPETAGVPMSERGPRLDDALTVIRDLVTGRPVDYTGRVVTITCPALEPAMSAPPPIYVGGRGEPAQRRAARFGDFWLPMWLSPERVAEGAERVAELAADLGRRAPATAMVILIRIDDDRSVGRAIAAAQLPHEHGADPEAVERWTVLDSIDGAVERLMGYREVGVEEIVLLPLGSDTPIQYERLAEVRDRLGAQTPVAGESAR